MTISIFEHLAARLGPFGFVPLERRWLHRKTWNTNRGVALAEARSLEELRAAVHPICEAAKPVLKHSWWSQLGLQIVFQTEGWLPGVGDLSPLVDSFNSQGVLVQSVFAIDRISRESLHARTWGQVVTGKCQDAIVVALGDAARST